ncbi:hypothetical protein PPERSA_00615 [Pseudocohnilembus persalinus]|uniref:Uncharacterized protein n=1 Tax=Pseudocohnilembus persalinus TaxID=266149 RepID=A0A0V0QSM5_PSEPJ|nr:hypothetical protein PPERSA_00615 [Pseudocohnilembus persalinus]|eukprot:KRX05314.1 hypothetical protein PPERSA_00615 [Pseudocohnilembus persalinus]
MYHWNIDSMFYVIGKITNLINQNIIQSDQFLNLRELILLSQSWKNLKELFIQNPPKSPVKQKISIQNQQIYPKNFHIDSDSENNSQLFQRLRQSRDLSSSQPNARPNTNQSLQKLKQPQNQQKQKNLKSTQDSDNSKNKKTLFSLEDSVESLSKSQKIPNNKQSQRNHNNSNNILISNQSYYTKDNLQENQQQQFQIHQKQNTPNRSHNKYRENSFILNTQRSDIEENEDLEIQLQKEARLGFLNRRSTVHVSDYLKYSHKNIQNEEQFVSQNINYRIKKVKNIAV